MPPSMSSSEALVIWMFRIAMNAPIMPATTAIHAVRLALSAGATGRAPMSGSLSAAPWAMFDMAGLLKTDAVRAGLALAVRGRGCAHFLALDVDGRNDGHAGAQFVGKRAAGIECDLDRDTLDHLGEVAGGVVGRQQGELLPARRGNAVHVALEGHARKSIDLDCGRLARADVGELRLLVVGDDVSRRRRYDGHELRPRLYVLADAQRAVADHAIDRRDDRRVGEVELGLPQQRFVTGERRLRLGKPGFQNVELRDGALQRSGVARQSGARRADPRSGLLGILDAA